MSEKTNTHKDWNDPEWLRTMIRSTEYLYKKMSRKEQRSEKGQNMLARIEKRTERYIELTGELPNW